MWFVCSCIHTHTHVCMHTYTNISHNHTTIHTYIHAYIHTYIHTTIHTYIHTYNHTYIHTYTQENNRVERTFGDGATRKRYSHIDLLCMIDGVETQKATVVAGSRCYYLKVAKLFLLQIPLLISCWLIFSKAWMKLTFLLTRGDDWFSMRAEKKPRHQYDKNIYR